MTRRASSSFFAALRFLTLVPVPESWCGGEEALALSPLFFPWVGLLIGGVVAAIGFGLDHVLPALAASVFVVIALVAASRGLHMDGLADTADGFFSSRSRERTLEIMRDSRTGAMGVTAIVAVFALKLALLASVGGPIRWRVILLMPLFGRCALVLLMGVLPYARAEGGLASAFIARPAGRCRPLEGAEPAAGPGAAAAPVASMASTVILSGRARSVIMVVWPIAVLLVAGWLVASYRGLAAGGAAVVVTVLFGLYSRHKIGGYTGDTLGAACELVELVPPLVGAIWPV